MTRFSARFSVAIAVATAFALAAMFTIELTPDGDECADEAALLNGRSIDRRTVLITEGVRGTDLSRARLTGRVPAEKGDEAPLVYTVTRSYGLRALLFAPAIALPGAGEPDVVERAELDVEGASLPLHYAYERYSKLLRLTAYFMTHRSRGIESPLWTLIADSPVALTLGRSPITLFAVSTDTGPRGRGDAERRIEEWIRVAWRHYRTTCGT